VKVRLDMGDIKEVRKLLDEINEAVASYDPLLKEQARDILLRKAFGGEVNTKPPLSSKHGSAGNEAKKEVAFHQLVEKWTPSTQAEWALLGAYYFQVILGHESVTGFEINRELKQHGNGMTNITSALEENINQTPALVRQVGKSGKTRQAKKKYIVTTNGVKVVREKLDAQRQS
jgi:hypothetical protein